MKGTFLGLVFLLAVTAVGQQFSLDLPSNVKELVPTNHRVLGATSADLDKDSDKDWLVVAEDASDPDAEDPARTVLLILQNGNGKLELAARSKRAVLGKAEGGVMGDPFESVSAKGGEFTIHHLGGSRMKWTAEFTFSYSPKDRTWLLSRVDDGRWTEDASKQTFQVPHDFGRITLAEFDIENWQGVGSGYRKSNLSKPTIPQ